MAELTKQGDKFNSVKVVVYAGWRCEVTDMTMTQWLETCSTPMRDVHNRRPRQILPKASVCQTTTEALVGRMPVMQGAYAKRVSNSALAMKLWGRRRWCLTGLSAGICGVRFHSPIDC